MIFRSDNLDSVTKPNAENDLWELVLSVEATPMLFGGLSKLEVHAGGRVELPALDKRSTRCRS